MVIVIVFVAMVVGNAVLSASGDALYGVYGELIAGDMSVSADAETNFTIFGSDQLLVGEYLTSEVIPEFVRIRTIVESHPMVRTTAGIVSATARVQMGGHVRIRTLFGVDFDAYHELFPKLRLVAGTFPRSHEPGIVVQEDWLTDGSDVTALIGQPVLLSVGTGRTFTLREVPVTGVFQYPVVDDLLGTVVLVDADTARALNGYLYGALEKIEISSDDQAILNAEVDTLFDESDMAEPVLGDASDAIDPNTLLGTDNLHTNRARETIMGSWNFLLIALHDRGDRPAVMRQLAAAGIDEEDGYRVRAWWGTIGGNASLVRYLQLLFNAGLIFVAIGAAIIATNALVLSVLERTSEIGTMRALGSMRYRVALLIFFETAAVVVSAAVFGIFLGTLTTYLLNVAEYRIANRYIDVLFGGGPIVGVVDATLVAVHVGAAFLLALVAVVYPIKRALAVSPREAMTA